MATPDQLTIPQPPNGPVHAGNRDAGRPDRQHPALRPLPLQRHLLHAMRGGRLPPHHLLSRPARRDGGLHHAHRGRQKRSAGAAVQRQPHRKRRLAGRPPFRGLARPASQAVLSVRAGRRRSGSRRGPFPHHVAGATSTLRIYVEHGKQDRCGYAMDSLKRSMRWDEERFGREYDLDIFMIVAVSDFNMGAMENKGLNVFNDKYVLASAATATDADFAAYRGGDRARIFPQLDRQPHHLPRLVPALPEGRPDGFPRPGIFRRHALARRSSASPTCAACAPRNSSRTRGPWRIRCGRKPTRRSTTSTRRPSTKKAPKWCAWWRR